MVSHRIPVSPLLLPIWQALAGFSCQVLGTYRRMRDMTGDADDNEDILGFGTDRARRAFRLDRLTPRLRLRLERLTLRLTRRPRLVVLAGGLAVVALVAGAVTYLGVAQPASRSAAGQPRSVPAVTGRCTVPKQSKLLAAEIAKLLKQLNHDQASSGSSGYSSTLTIVANSASGTARSPFGVGVTVNPATGQITCP
jgi:hypothetical protein